MPKLIKNGQLADNPWTLVPKDESLEDCLRRSETALLLPLRLWLDGRHELLSGERKLAVWLDSDESPEAIADNLEELPLVALNFPTFMDGRSYSTAVSLRQRYRYSGELRAIGDVLRDQLFYMKRCGFDSFDVSDSVEIEDALKAFEDFHTTYASSIEEPRPLFRRRAS